MRRRKSAQDVAKKWARNLGAAAEAIKTGVASVTVSPTELAAQAKDRYVEGVNRAVADGRWEQNLRKVSTQDWQRAMMEKGVPRIAAGANGAVDDFARFQTEFGQHLDALDAKLSSMPRGDLEQNLARMREAAVHNSQFRRSGR